MAEVAATNAAKPIVAQNVVETKVEAKKTEDVQSGVKVH